MAKIIGFDIETVPQVLPLSKSQEKWLLNKVAPAMDKSRPEETEEEIKNRIMGTSPYLGEIVCIGVGEILPSGEIQTKSLIGDEKTILKNFWEGIKHVSQPVFVSFNGLKFDTNFIIIRSIHHGIAPTNREFLNTIKFRKAPHYDVMQWLSDWNWPAPTLDLACDLVGVVTPKGGNIEAKDVARAFSEGKIKEIAAYCERDVKATLEVYLKIKNYIRD